jgi:hypothetical protein
MNALRKGDNVDDGDDNVDNMMMLMLMIRREKIWKSTSYVVKADIILALINEQSRKDKVYTCIHKKYRHCFLHAIICIDAICICLLFILILHISMLPELLLF